MLNLITTCNCSSVATHPHDGIGVALGVEHVRHAVGEVDKGQVDALAGPTFY